MNRLDALAKCPFYRAINHRTRGGHVDCSEGFGKGKITIRFRQTDELNLHFELRCCEFYAKCPVYRLIMEENYEPKT